LALSLVTSRELQRRVEVAFIVWKLGQRQNAADAVVVTVVFFPSDNHSIYKHQPQQPF
jgi:hypothetical protein